MGKTLILIGLVLVAAGLLWMGAERLGFGRLPGDIVIARGPVRFYFPIVTCLILSVVISLVLWLLRR